jgi:hypothetical protein
MNMKNIPKEELEKLLVKENKQKFELIESLFYQLNNFTQSSNRFFNKNRLPFKLNMEINKKMMDSIIGIDSQEDMILPKS